MAEFLFVGSLALIFATLSVIFIFVAAVVIMNFVEEAKTYILIHKMGRTSREMKKVAARLEEATTVVLFNRVEEYRNGL
jgi:uncharacterized membrane protein